MAKKRLFLIIVSYLIFFVLLGMALFLVSKWGLNYRNMSYYNKEVFPLYGSEKYDEFMAKTTNQFNADIQKSNLYEYEYNPFLYGLSYKIIIKKIKKRNSKDEGILIYFNKLEFISKKNHKYNLMYPERATPAKDNYKYFGWLTIEFSVKDKTFASEHRNALKSGIDPFRPFYFYASWFGKNNYLTGIKLRFNENIINQDSYAENNYLILSTNESSFWEEVATTKENFAFNNLSKLENSDTQKFIKSNYRGHNKVLITLLSSVITMFLIVFYFVFINKLLLNYLKKRKKDKSDLANKKIETVLTPSNEIVQDE